MNALFDSELTILMNNIVKNLTQHWFLFLAIASLVLTGCNNNDLQKGEECLKIGDFYNALNFFDRAVKNNPSSPVARYGFARAWYQKCQYLEKERLENENDLREAIRNLEYSSNLGFRDSLYTHLAYLLYRLSKIHILKNDSIMALNLANKAVKIDQKNNDILNYTGILNYHLGNQNTAEDCFILASKNDSTDATGLFNLGMIAWYEKDYKLAYLFWSRALNRAPDNETIINWYAESKVMLMETEKDVKNR
ncbi:MAG: hypothetical protein PVI26_11790 [Chitinispirillia bacterium]